MHLPLKHSDSVVQLGCYAEGLIRRRVIGPNKWGIVCRDFGDIAICPIAEFGVIVARRDGSRLGSSRCGRI
jgi:hypothetical protein